MATMASTELLLSAIRSKGNSQVELGGARWSGRGCSGMGNRTGQGAGAYYRCRVSSDPALFYFEKTYTREQ